MTNPNSIHLNFCLNIHLPLRNSKGKKCGTQRELSGDLEKRRNEWKKGSHVSEFFESQQSACMTSFDEDGMSVLHHAFL